MGLGFLFLGFIVALAIAALSTRAEGILRQLVLGIAAVVFVIVLVFSSIAYVGPDEVGIVTKNALGSELKDGRIIAENGQMGVQADVLAPGWHAGIWPVIYSVTRDTLTEISGDEIGLVETRDGQPLGPGQLFAPAWSEGEFQQMLDAKHFLSSGKGYKGKQSVVLTPGKYRINKQLYKITPVKVTEVKAGEVAVIKANYGRLPSLKVALPSADPKGQPEEITLASEGEMGVRATVLPPGKYPINTDAFTIVDIWTTEMVAHYTMAQSGNPVSSSGGGTGHANALEEREIIVRTADGFTFPVDVRVSYKIEPGNAPVVVARLGDDEGETFRNVLNTIVRAAFRNAAEGVRALDYVQQRSHQEQSALGAIARDMRPLGVTVTGVNIGSIGNEATLGSLLKTQTDRELAKQEQVTFSEQQKAAEKKKELTRTQQESEEEKKLATAAYAVKIAEQENTRKIIEAKTESESLNIRAQGQAKAYEQVAQQIGRSNVAMIELLKIVGDKQIQITPRVMLGAQHAGDGATSALIGTILDQMVTREDKPAPEKK